jgi:hypothetical protein
VAGDPALPPRELLTEPIRAHNNPDFFNYKVVPIPWLASSQASKPDF